MVFLTTLYTKCLESCAKEIRAWDLANPSDVVRDEATAERWIRIRGTYLTQLSMLSSFVFPFVYVSYALVFLSQLFLSKSDVNSLFLSSSNSPFTLICVTPIQWFEHN